MEEENNRDGQNTAPVEEVSKEQVEQACEVQEQKKQEYRPRKNGRNKTGVRSSSLKSAPAKESCGEVEDISNFKEKLSGSNVSGYGSDKGKSFGDEGEKFRRRRREEPSAEASETAGAEQPSQKSEAGAEETPAAEKTPEGPFFESKKFTPRAVEVPLTDKRPKFSNDKSPRDDGVVSYSAKMDCPSLSLFSRIKNAIASIFGKKPEHGKKKFHKDRRNGDFKGRRHGGDRRPYNKDRRNGDFKRRHDSDRRQGGRHNRDNRAPREG